MCVTIWLLSQKCEQVYKLFNGEFIKSAFADYKIN